MCNNYPNCNCSSCSQCQSCTQVTPTCNCTTTCTCTTEQFTEECPCGLQSTNCLIYTGDNLQDCDGNDYLFRGTNFNTFLSQLWDTVRCAATPTTNTINYTGANIRNCDNTATVVATGSSLTVALNNIWNAVKCVYNDINKKQPVWQGSATITIGASQTAPFNNINTALAELSKYHFNNSTITLNLEDGIYTLNSQSEFGALLQDKNFLEIQSLSGIKENVTIKGSAGQGVHSFSIGFIIFRNLTLASENNAAIIGLFATGAFASLINVKITNNSSSSNLFAVSEGATLLMTNCTFVDLNTTNTQAFLVAERKGNILITGSTFTVNRTFISTRDGSLYISDSFVNFTNPSQLTLFIMTGNSNLTLGNTPLINTNPSIAPSNVFYLEQSNVIIYNYYDVVTSCILGFDVVFNQTNNSSVIIYNKNEKSEYTNSVFASVTTGSFTMWKGKVKGYNYNVATQGIANISGKVRLNAVSIEAHRVITSWNNGDNTFENCTFIFNTIYALANPTQSRIYIWEDNGNTSSFTGCTFDLNNLSLGIRTSVNGTQFWIDSGTFLNTGASPALNSNFNSIIYAPLVTAIPKVADASSYTF